MDGSTPSRRAFLGRLGAGFGALAKGRSLLAEALMRHDEGPMKRRLLSSDGGDRATAYAMSNKIVMLPQGYLCTWIDRRCQNQSALVDADTGQIRHRWPLGKPRVDNHCGAALALVDGHVHAVTGGHHTPLEHYLLDASGDRAWRHVATISAKATYPSVACDSAGRLHLAFRCRGAGRWTLNTCRFDGTVWSPPRPIVKAQKPGYVYWTNALAAGPKGRLHLVFGNPRALRDGSTYYGASHLHSDDGGETWASFDAGPIGSTPAAAESIPCLENEPSPARIQSAAHRRSCDQPGPRHFHYQKLLLSNPVVDDDGAPHVIVHNGLDGTAELWSHVGGHWTARSLTDVLTQGDSKKRVHMQSSLSLDGRGRLNAALVIEPTRQCVWGPPGTYIVRVLVSRTSRALKAETVCRPEKDTAQWLPALAHRAAGGCGSALPLLYTRGHNAGGFNSNKNTLATEVWLVRPRTR